MDAQETKRLEPTNWVGIIGIILAIVIVSVMFARTIENDKQESYEKGYTEGQNSVSVKYSFHGTVQYIDASHRSFFEIGLPYGCKLYQNNSEYGCKWLTDTLKVELTTK